MNQARLSGSLLEKKAKRYTPAGLPVVEALLSHESTVTEAGLSRQVAMEVRLKAIGQIAERLERVSLGKKLNVEGFLAPARLASRQLNVHVTNFDVE